ncbi:hypothetical protein ACFLTS_01995 [Chloroflexota bacterium]
MKLQRSGKILLVLRTLDQLSTVNKLIRGWSSKSVTVISGHPTVDIELRRQQVPFKSLYDMVPMHVFKGCETEVNELTDIFTSILKRLWPDELLMIDGLRPNSHTIAQDFVRSEITIQTLFRKLNPEEVWIISNINIPRILDVELSSDIFDAMLLHHAGNKGLRVRLIRHSSPLSNWLLQFRHHISKSIFGPYLRLLLRYAGVIKNKPERTFVIPPKTSCHRIMLIGSDFDFEHLLPLAQHLNQGRLTEAIHVFMGDPYNWMSPNTYNYMSRHPETWVDYGQFTRRYPTQRTAYLPSVCFSEELKSIVPKWREWLSSPHLDFQLHWLFYDAPKRLLQGADLWTTLFKAYKPDIAILMQDSTFDYADQSIALKRLGIRSVLLPHSAIVNATPSASRFLSDQAFVWGELMRDELIQMGVESTRLFVTGTIKELKRFGHLKDEKQQQLNALGLSSQCKTLLMLTSGSFERWLIPYVDVKEHLASIKAVVQYVAQRPDVQLIIKTHPRRDYPIVYTEMISRLGDTSNLSDKIKVITKIDLSDMLAVADAIVVPNTHTTASLESLVAAQPLVYISSGRIYDKGFSWGKHTGSLIINALEDIPPALDEVLDNNSIRKRLITEGQKLLTRYYDAKGIESISRIEKLLVGN